MRLKEIFFRLKEIFFRKCLLDAGTGGTGGAYVLGIRYPIWEYGRMYDPSSTPGTPTGSDAGLVG